MEITSIAFGVVVFVGLIGMAMGIGIALGLDETLNEQRQQDRSDE